MVVLAANIWSQSNCFCDLALRETLGAFAGLQHNVAFFDFPQTVLSGLGFNDHKVNCNVRLQIRLVVLSIDILLHQTNNNSCLLVHSQAVLRIVEPLVIRVNDVHTNTLVLLSVGLLFLILLLMHCWIRASVRITLPFSVNRVLGPSLWKNLANIQAVEVRLPVFESHPPIVVLVELVVQKQLEALVIIPSFVFIRKTTLPFSALGAPGITGVEHLKLVLLC